jgi:hypothetical protein
MFPMQNAGLIKRSALIPLSGFIKNISFSSSVAVQVDSGHISISGLLNTLPYVCQKKNLKYLIIYFISCVGYHISLSTRLASERLKPRPVRGEPIYFQEYDHLIERSRKPAQVEAQLQADNPGASSGISG